MNTMPNAMLVDAGPLIAALSPADNEQPRCKAFFRSNKRPMLTTWAVLAEVSHMLKPNVISQIALLNWVKAGGIEVQHISSDHIAQMIAYTDKYRDRPMDLADATLVALAATTGIRDIASLDSDFDIYRLPNRARLNNVLAHQAT